MKMLPLPCLATAIFAVLCALRFHSAAHAFHLQQDNIRQRFSTQLYEGIRINKVFKATHSRRKADELVLDGRVAVNGEVISDMGRRVVPFEDTIELDGRVYSGWEERNGFEEGNAESAAVDVVRPDEDYIKFWKPVGVTSTTDRRVRGNLIEAMDYRFHNRIFSVGRLDKDSSGILLMTSDGRIPNAVLTKEARRPKTYEVTVDKPLRKQDLKQLANGLVITTDTVKNGRHVPLTARTMPCKVKRLGERTLLMTLYEGRNRQIRVMLKAVHGYNVIDLHRVEFMGIGLDGLSGPGDWMTLSKAEKALVEDALRVSSDNP